MFVLPTARRPLGLAASLLSCLVIATASLPASAADDQGYLGVLLQDLTPSMTKALQLGDQSGVMINDVVDGSPAEKAGLLDGDVILEINGNKVADYAALTGSVRKLAPGQTATLLVLRDGKQKNVKVEIGKLDARPDWLGAPDDEDGQSLAELHKLKGLEGLENLKGLEKMKWFDGEDGKVMVLPHGEGEAPRIYFHGDGDSEDEDGARKRIIVRTIDEDRGWLGVHLDALNGQLGEYFGVKDGAGVLVTEVVDDSPAAKSGLKAGDVIVKVGDTKVDSPDALHEAMAGTKPGDDLALQVLRKGSAKSVTAKLGEMPADAAGSRRLEFIGQGEPGEMKMMAPRMLRRMGRGGDAGEEREIVIERRRQAGDEMSEVREEMEALRQELKKLREELKR